MPNKKVTIIGSGNVGSQAAMLIGIKNIANIVLIDILEGIPQGKALDIQQAMPLFGSDSKIIGTNDYKDTKDSDIVVITAGIARKPGMTREDLLNTNAKIITEVTNNVIKYSSDPIIINVTNPLDAITYLVHKVSKLPKNKVIGMAGVLDSARFATFIGQELDTSFKNIECMVIGSHGQGMTALVSNSKVDGRPVNIIMDKETLNSLVKRVKGAGLEIVDYLKTGSAFFAPGASIASMVESIVNDQKKIMPCTVYLDGEYGCSDVFIGVPVRLGKEGVEEIVEINLSQEEKKEFYENVGNIKNQNLLLRF